MFACKSCSRSILQALLSASNVEYAAASRSWSTNSLPLIYGRSAFTTSSTPLASKGTPEEQTRRDAGLPIDIQTYEEAGTAVLKGNIKPRKLQIYQKTGDEVLKGKASTGGQSSVQRSQDVSVWDGKTPINRVKLDRHARLELQHIKEPYRLAERCLAILKSGEFDLAISLAQHAGRQGMDATVSWNHIINTATKAGNLEVAYKLYNLMKKRAQNPDGYTYSILLRGYSGQKSLSAAEFERAKTIYESLYRPNSPVKPNIIHGNIMLELCGRLEELNTMFEIASKLSERGSNAPDQITYTTIFNALSNAKFPTFGTEKRDRLRQEAVTNARKVWADVLEKWEAGSMLLGEELVCAMGRVLLSSSSQEDHESVLTLLEQAMRVPRQVSGSALSLADSRMHSDGEEVKRSYHDIQSQTKSLDTRDAPTSSTVWTRPTSGKADFLHPPGLIFSKPGNRTLSLALTTCAKLGQYKLAIKYWDFFTSQFTPDTYNLIEYMRQMKITANTTLATTVLREAYKLSKDRKKTIQLHPALWEYGMDACYRKTDAKIALRDATRILVLLQMSTAEPSFSVIECFTKLLSKVNAGFPINDIMRAVESLMMVFGNFKSLYAFGRTESNGPPVASTTLDGLISDVDPQWRPTSQPPYRLSMSRVSLLTEARSGLSLEERKGIRQLGRQIEAALGSILRNYANSMSHDQVARIRSDLYRVRAWVFPRDQRLLEIEIEEDAIKKQKDSYQRATEQTRNSYPDRQTSHDKQDTVAQQALPQLGRRSPIATPGV